MKPKHLDLFSGIGGFSFAFEAEGFETVAFCESDEIKRIVLRHWWPGVPILPDVRDTSAIAEFCRQHGPITLVTGGVPCQPTSSLGQKRGTSDERWLWPDTIRVVGAVRPRFAVFENPPAILTLEGGRAWNGIVSGLGALRYDLWWDVFPAAVFGAGHIRERVLLICADAQGVGTGVTSDEGIPQPASGEARHELVRHDERAAANTDGTGLQGHAGYGYRNGGGRSRIDQLPRRIYYEISSNPNRQRRTEPGQHENELHQAPKGDGQVTSLVDGVTIPSIAGRVRDFGNGLPWWHEANTGVPVLAHGLPNKLVEAATRCTGDAIVPQVLAPIAKAIKAEIEKEKR